MPTVPTLAARLADRVVGTLPRSLFQRAFLAFWLAMAMIVVCGMAVTALVAEARGDALDAVDPTMLVAEAKAAARQGGKPALARWVRITQQNHPTLAVYVFDRQRRELLERALPRRLEHWLETYMDHLEHDSLPANFYSRQEKMSWWEVHELALADGSRLVLRFLPFDSSPLAVLGVGYVPLLLLLIMLLLSAPVCWLLALYVSNPVRHLEQGAQAIGAGDLDIHVDAELLRRRDEVGALARAFEQMAQRLRSLMASKENLLRDVSHELRSPLTRLRMALELARLAPADNGAQLDRIECECLRLDDMVGQLLLLARLRNAPPDMPAPVEMGALIAQVATDAAFEAQALARTVELEMAPQMQRVRVLGLAPLLASALENVVRNALRFTAPGSSVKLQVVVGDAELAITVMDHGPGVPPADFETLFEPFFRGASASHADGGAGLGLAIAQAVLERHGGSIAASNLRGTGQPHQGLAVCLTLPLLLAP